MNRRALFLKALLSLVVAGIAVASIVIAWSPLLITYVPIAQSYDISPKSAEIVENILLARNENFASVLKVSAVLILINLLASLVIIWVAKFDGNRNT